MRYRSFLFDRQTKKPSQFGIRTLLGGISLVAVLLAIRAYALVWLVTLTTLVALVSNLIAIVSQRQRHQIEGRESAGIRRFWCQSTKPAYDWGIPEPIIPVVIYIVVFVTWHLSLHVIVGVDYLNVFFDEVNGTGTSLRAMDHALNATVFAYLLVNWSASLFPYSRTNKRERIPIIVTATVVAAMHFAIP